jgi:hypothetical protein
MSDAAPAAAVSQWEYIELTRKTESYLLNDLNDLGRAGWELVTVLYHRDIKMGESWSWTAFLKRPTTGQPQVGAAVGRAAALEPEPCLQPADAEGEVLEIFEVEEE